MKALDTSVVVAAFATWHEGHVAAFESLKANPHLPAHVALETYSVLTRLPPPHRASAGIVVAFLDAHFATPFLTLPAQEHLELIRRAPRAGLVGGAIYDALVAATAKHAGATLLTRDRRAVPIYESLGAAFELVV